MTNLIKLTSKNYHSAYTIHCQGHSHPWSKSVFSDCLTDQYEAYGLRQDDEFIGLYVALFVLDEATLMDIGVSSDMQGKGLSNKLMAHFITRCVDNNMQCIWLEVRATNGVAISLYQKQGFELIERRKGYYDTVDGKEDALIMKLTLIDIQEMSI